MNDMEIIVIKEFYENEKTELGKMTIRALCDLLGVELE
jgi:hypothetical protein